ncbi:MAG: outer membrane beta-barrel protein [Saprospiraceae bacterium]
MRIFFTTILVFVATWAIQAQGEFSGGFKAGLNFNNFQTDALEPGETYSTSVGFHIGDTFIYSVTDLFGVKGEFIYNQKGVQYTYEGDSYYTLYLRDLDAPFYATGTRKSDFNVTNSYLDIPLMVYYKIGKLELEAGVNAGILVGSRGSGAVTFSGTAQNGTPISSFTANVDYAYYNNDRGRDALIAAEPFDLASGVIALRPVTVGAYYEAADNDENKYNTIDFGLNAGLAFFISKGLYIGARLNYGLTDVTNEAQDLSQVRLLPGNKYETRNDNDQNLSIQTSVGFRF